ncbi:HAD family hydrolase [Pseudactinotalea sp. HY158]|uniref:HAD family hydrolase n=1 Tax=Pseudactinotalea sp. HY158 TaxID=2654547 RepID=UPI001E4D46C0|nr:HAD family hydrolase [Pseudactinotalea sp. HY158]
MTPPYFPGALLTLTPGAGTLVALDIDGTILGHDGSLAPEVTAVIDQLVDDGTHLVLASGRSLTAVLPVIEQLGLSSGWAVCSNGAVTIRYGDRTRGGGSDRAPGADGVGSDGAHGAGTDGADRDGADRDGAHGAARGSISSIPYTVEDLVTFDPEPALRKLREHVPDALYAVEVLGEGFMVTEPFPLGELTGRQDVVPFDELSRSAASRVTVRAPDLTAADFHELVDRTGLHGVSYAVGWTAWLDLSPAGVSKASALEVVRQRLGVDGASTLAAGDGRNDIDMLGWAGYGIAMGDADEITRAAADYTTGSVAENGLVPVLSGLYPDSLGSRRSSDPLPDPR